MATREVDIQPDRGRPRYRRAVLALLATCAVGVAACGGGGSHTSTATGAVTNSATTGAAQIAAVQSTTTRKTATPADPPTQTAKRAPATRVRFHRWHRFSPLPAATARQSEQVGSCLSGAGLGHVSVALGRIWTGYDAKTGSFVYVELYPTVAAAMADVRRLSGEDATPAGMYVVHQPIARYPGSPVATVAACLTGRPPSNAGSNHNPGKKPKSSFTF